jgi:HD-like signal output (HDOD) protein
VARMLAAQKNIEQTEQMFVSGLLHDIGRLFIFKHYPKHAGACLGSAACCGGCVLQAEKNIIGLDHAQIGLCLLRKWGLPLDLENNIGFHHAPSQAREPLTAGIVHLADLIVHALGIGSSGERCVPVFDGALVEAIGFSPNAIQTVMRRAIHQLGSIEAMFESH